MKNTMPSAELSGVVSKGHKTIYLHHLNKLDKEYAYQNMSSVFCDNLKLQAWFKSVSRCTDKTDIQITSTTNIH